MDSSNSRRALYGICCPCFMFSRPGLSAPLPYAHAGQLVTIGIKAPVLEFDFLFANDYLYLRQSTTPFTQITSGTGEPECDLTQESPLRLTCAQVESNFLPTLGVNPILGRNFTSEEDRLGAYNVALISYALCQSRFGASPRVLEQSLSVEGSRVQVIGVLPREFEFPSLNNIDLLVPRRLRITTCVPIRPVVLSTP